MSIRLEKKLLDIGKSRETQKIPEENQTIPAKQELQK